MCFHNFWYKLGLIVTSNSFTTKQSCQREPVGTLRKVQFLANELLVNQVAELKGERKRQN